MSNENKKAKFFCENCSSEVAANARFCPKCGKFFSAVRCPKCFHTGTVRVFKNGCPKCGYSMSEHELFGTSTTPDGTGQKKLSSSSKKKIKNAFKTFNKKNKVSRNSDGFPLWVFGASILILGLLVAFIFLQCGEGNSTSFF